MGVSIASQTLYYAFRSFSNEADALEWAQHPNHFELWVIWSTGERQVIKTANTLPVAQEVKQRISVLKDYMSEEADYALREERADGFRAALMNNQTVPTLSVCTQLMADGLVVQALGDIAQECSRVLSKAARASKSISKKRYMAIQDVWDFCKETLSAITKGDLATQWGVIAPTKDYLQLVDALLQNDWHPYFDGSTVSRISRPAISVGKGEHQLVFGVNYDYFNGSTVEDVMALIHQGGFDLSASQLWDLIPFSFAADWIFDTSQLLDDLWASLEYYRYPIRYCWETDKFTVPITFHGRQLKVVLYVRRKIKPQVVLDAIAVHSSDLLVDSDYHGTFSVRNIKELVCLVYQLFA
jgi:hypothetical protein